jgi:hypothetical protein
VQQLLLEHALLDHAGFLEDGSAVSSHTAVLEDPGEAR